MYVYICANCSVHINLLVQLWDCPRGIGQQYDYHSSEETTSHVFSMR